MDDDALPDGLLAQAEELLQRDHGLALEEPALNTLIRQSRTQKQAIERRRRRLLAGALIAALVFAVVTALALVQWDVAVRERDNARIANGRFFGTEAQRRLKLPITQDSSPLIAFLGTTGWRLAKTSDAWNAMQRVPLVAEVTRITHGGAVQGVAFSPDGTRFATASDDGTARIAAAGDGRESARINHDDRVWAVAFSPDGTRLATASLDGTTRIVSVAEGRELARITHDDGVYAVAFSPDGARLATVGDNNVLRLWATSLDEMLLRLCAGYGHNLSLSVWRREFGDLPWQSTCENWPTPKD